MSTLVLAFFRVAVLIYSVVIHEISHGLAANSLGDATAKNLGRLTLNPIRHLDLFGSVLLPLFLFLVGSPFIFGYAKPVPYNPLNLSDRRFGPAKVAVAGPLSNIALAVLFGAVFRFLPDVFSSALVPQLLTEIIIINLVLAVFNLFPVPPLDGHWLLISMLPFRLRWIQDFMYRYSLFLFFIFLFFIFPLIIPVIPFLFKLITGINL